ncbi:MAG: hypothetical protein A3F82_06730 [Deltaproteobacteria bacterium RIFCSPLOWO2_12_FULL_44_12]|nr:MAG: hypothetical protein A2712_09565 [Deltaproteobacteria bacterium RIFCSPHIGHO2_01_FULL_43_49]OGQ14935.1 MAG: hypothetical protein A3D22_00120 [Deltaproteobacteria bacterium RIFCSPHIGHO2_02_FULL_44_53]OGQ29561.1 MAG: hypothetical protein A3D98_10295 [Deltaproteobacteria bacterium RIFCSPHIGHO2_12_FULL_44_21]OGQ31047.1 MAG: hypothetical protein A2979_06410 [Deltaproteobacteria bacterium RIFCSPLOWO2_01_FULL_45_74]OGQ42649.1 MAG: hypothetical protein A3I70_02080 [Deltaproteobacteria bacterium 
MASRIEEKTPPQKPDQKSEWSQTKNRWNRETGSKSMGPSRTNKPHVPFGVGKHRKSFGHV